MSTKIHDITWSGFSSSDPFDELWEERVAQPDYEPEKDPEDDS